MENYSVNNNAALYTSLGATAGAGIGAAAGYFTKPYLKNDQPTDEFIKKAYSKIAEKTDMKDAFDESTKAISSIKKATNIEELKSLIFGDWLDKKNFETNKLSIIEDLKEFVSIYGDKETVAELEKIKNFENFEQMQGFCDKHFEKLCKEKSLKEIKSTFLKYCKESDRKIFSACIFEPYWDSTKKEFINCEKGSEGEILKKAAKSIQGKYAAIYGAIGAAVIGGITYLCTPHRRKS